MIYSFANIEDSPDIEIKHGQHIYISYDYLWGLIPRHKEGAFIFPCHMHLKDFLKGRQSMLRAAYHHNQAILGGDRPTLSNINFEVLSVPVAG